FANSGTTCQLKLNGRPKTSPASSRGDGYGGVITEAIKLSTRRAFSRIVMSALGQKQTSRLLEGMSALPPKADIATRSRNVRLVQKADKLRRKLVIIRS